MHSMPLLVQLEHVVLKEHGFLQGLAFWFGLTEKEKEAIQYVVLNRLFLLYIQDIKFNPDIFSLLKNLEYFQIMLAHEECI